MTERYEKIEKGIFRRGDRYYVSANVDGKTVRTVAKRPDGSPVQTIVQARAARTILSGSVQAGHYVPADKKKLTIGQILDGLLADWKTAGPEGGPIATYDNASKQVEIVREAFGARRALEFTYKLAAGYVAEGKTLGEKSTRSARMAMLKRAFNVAVRDGLLDKAPKFPERIDNVRQGFITPEAFEAIVAEFEGVDAQLLRFLYTAGQRLQRSLDLCHHDVDTVCWTIPGERERGNKSRPPIKLVGEARLIVEERLRAGKAPWWLFHRDGKQITQAAIYAKFHKCMRRRAAAGCDHVEAKLRPCRECAKGLWTLHDLRRSCARNLVESGVHPVVAARVTGHRSLSMFSRYAVALDEAVDRALIQRDAYVADRLKDRGLESSLDRPSTVQTEPEVSK